MSMMYFFLMYLYRSPYQIRVRSSRAAVMSEIRSAVAELTRTIERQVILESKGTEGVTTTGSNIGRRSTSIRNAHVVSDDDNFREKGRENDSSISIAAHRTLLMTWSYEEEVGKLLSHLYRLQKLLVLHTAMFDWDALKRLQVR